MTDEQLAEIRKQVEKLSKGNILRDTRVLALNNKVVFEDVPKLLAEIERLRLALAEISDINEYVSGDVAREVLKNAEA
jgi:hypothetical protein